MLHYIAAVGAVVSSTFRKYGRVRLGLHTNDPDNLDCIVKLDLD
jgi:hypothetical protein